MIVRSRRRSRPAARRCRTGRSRIRTDSSSAASGARWARGPTGTWSTSRQQSFGRVAANDHAVAARPRCRSGRWRPVRRDGPGERSTPVGLQARRLEWRLPRGGDHDRPADRRERGRRELRRGQDDPTRLLRLDRHLPRDAVDGQCRHRVLPRCPRRPVAGRDGSLEVDERVLRRVGADVGVQVGGQADRRCPRRPCPARAVVVALDSVSPVQTRTHGPSRWPSAARMPRSRSVASDSSPVASAPTASHARSVDGQRRVRRGLPDLARRPDRPIAASPTRAIRWRSGVSDWFARDRPEILLEVLSRNGRVIGERREHAEFEVGRRVREQTRAPGRARTGRDRGPRSLTSEAGILNASVRTVCATAPASVSSRRPVSWAESARPSRTGRTRPRPASAEHHRREAVGPALDLESGSQRRRRRARRHRTGRDRP